MGPGGLINRFANGFSMMQLSTLILVLVSGRQVIDLVGWLARSVATASVGGTPRATASRGFGRRRPQSWRR